MTDPQGNETTVEGTTPPIPSDTKPAEPDSRELPDGVAERTAAEFEKLKQHNAELKQKLSGYENKSSVLDDLKPAPVAVPPTPNLSETEVKEIKSSLVDSNGYVDVTRLEKALTDADTRARNAELRAQQAEQRVSRFEESTQVRAAHEKYPQLDPKNGEAFDPQFYELVKNELIGQMMKGEQDIVKAAEKVAKLYQQPKSNERAVQDYKAQVTKRTQATVTTAGKGNEAPTERAELIKRTRKGDNNALYKRLQASGN